MNLLKKRDYAILAFIAIIGILVYSLISPATFGIKEDKVYAATINVEHNENGIEYVSLYKGADIALYRVTENATEVKIYNNVREIIIKGDGTKFFVNGNQYLPTAPTFRGADGKLMISTSDYFNLFNLTSVKVSDLVYEVQAVPTNLNSTNAQLDVDLYKVGSDWGETVPQIIKEKGQLTIDITAIYQTNTYGMEVTPDIKVELSETTDEEEPQKGTNQN